MRLRNPAEGKYQMQSVYYSSRKGEIEALPPEDPKNSPQKAGQFLLFAGNIRFFHLLYSSTIR